MSKPVANKIMYTMTMYPVLFTIAGFSITSFGFLLVVAYLFALYVIWRLTNVYAYDKEKVLDLFLVGTLSSLIGGRLAYVLLNRDLFHPWQNIFAITQYPGFNFWGGFILATIVIAVLCRRFKLQLWQVADIAIVGMIAGMVPASLGCLLGSCHSGYPTTWPIAVTQVGLLDKRFPIQIFEIIIFAIISWYLWRISLKFHFVGRVALMGMVMFSIAYFMIAILRADEPPVLIGLSLNQYVSVFVALVSAGLYYRLSHRTVAKDAKHFSQLMTSPKARISALSRLRRTCYNLVAGTRRSFRSLVKKANVKPTPKKF